MHPFRIIEDKILHELPVECGTIIKKQRGVIIDEFFLDGAVEPLNVRVHFRRLGIGVKMRHMQPPQLFGKMLFEFAAVIGEHVGKTIRQRKSPLT